VKDSICHGVEISLYQLLAESQRSLGHFVVTKGFSSFRDFPMSLCQVIIFVAVESQLTAQMELDFIIIEYMML
jgi:hypothetical protein